MADYTIIADLSAHLVNCLREKMCPEPVANPGSIAVSSPADPDSDCILGVYLYDLREDGEITRPLMMQEGFSRMRRPPRCYALDYMLFVNASAQLGLKAPDVQKILGRAAQIINDASAVLPTSLQPWLAQPEPPVLFGAEKLPLDDKARVWQAIGKPYQVSLFYRAAPVFLSSEIVRETVRVAEAEFGISPPRREDGG